MFSPKMLSRFARAFIVIILALFLLTSLAFFHAPSRAYLDPWTGDLFAEGGVEKQWERIQHPGGLEHNNHSEGRPKHPIRPPSAKQQAPVVAAADVTSTTTTPELDRMDVNPTGAVHGGVIMSKLGNATAKAELGRASWKLLHTMTLRYPETPTADEREALTSYFHLFSRLYPCGECAAEFQQLLKQYPVQSSGRKATAIWLCVVHNKVNERVKKPEFDCANLDATYDCGCGDDPSESSSAASSTATNKVTDVIGHLHEPMEDDMNVDRDTGVGMIKGGR